MKKTIKANMRAAIRHVQGDDFPREFFSPALFFLLIRNFTTFLPLSTAGSQADTGTDEACADHPLDPAADGGF